jgi:hypothetical protein
MKSTSIHSLNADTGLNIVLKPVYLFLNWLNNLLPYLNVDPRIEFKKFSELNWEPELDRTFPQSSVGRRFSDVFWRALPWQKIEEELGEIHIFDTGCGLGNYGTRLLDASGGRVASYTGIDAKRRENWTELEKIHPKFKFIESRSSQILDLIPRETNLFITQSAIEHFDNDMAYFDQIRAFVERTGKPIIQIHNFPGRAILPLYLFHGIRQYTPRTISKITCLFKDSQVYLYGLGGKMGKKLQFKYFTWPLLILRGKAKWSEDVVKYDHEVRKAIHYDVSHPVSSPVFWVLIIHSHLKNKIW